MVAEPIERHISELRRRVIIVFLSVVTVFLASLAFSGKIVLYVVGYLSHPNITIVSLTPVEAFYSQIYAALFVSLFVTLPIIMYHVVMFLRPALNKRERRALLLVLPSFLLLFFIGVAFNFFVMLKLFLYFLSEFAARMGIYNMWGIGSLLKMAFFSSLILGIIFTLPLLFLLLSKLGIIRYNSLKRFRKEVYVAVFILAALLTPPDPVTQVAIALPLILLYEFSIIIVKLFS